MTLGAKARQAKGLPKAQVDSATRRARVDQVMDLHASGEWALNGRRLARELAKQWGVAINTVERYSCEANELLTRDRMTQLQVKDAVNANLWDVVRQAKRDRRAPPDEKHPEGKLLQKRDLSAVNAALKSLMRLNGLEAPTRHELTGADGGPVQVTDVELQAKAIDMVLSPEESDHYASTGELPADYAQRLNGKAAH